MNDIDSCSEDMEPEEMQKELDLMAKDSGPDMNLPYTTPIHEMVTMNQLEQVRKLLGKGTDANLPDFYGETPLFRALKPEIVDLLVAEGANIEWRSTIANASALYKFASDGRHKALKALARHLQTQGSLDAFVNDPATHSRRTPLHAAAANGHVETVKELLSFGAEAGAKDRQGRTALDLARIRKQEEDVP